MDALVIHASQFRAFANGQSVLCIYCPGRMSADEFDIRLRNGQYVLIYSNTMSVVSSKSVETEMEVN